MYNRDPADLFARLPGHFRTRDAEGGRPLQALMEIARSELGIVERDLDLAYDNWFVETCEPWVLPYIAALIGATPMREIGADDQGLLRGYIANVLANRQAKGTAAAVEQVAREVSGWSVLAVEFFQRLATSQNVNHVRPVAAAFADVRDSARARTSRSPFSMMPHSAAAGQPAGWSGRYNIPHLGLFIWRHAAAPIGPVADVDAGYQGGAMARVHEAGPGLLNFDPLGRDLPLVNRPDADLSVAARMTPRTVPGLLSREEVHAALNAARVDGVTPGRWFENSPPFRVRLDGAELPPQQIRGCNLGLTAEGGWRRPGAAGEVLVDPELGRISLHPDDEGLPVETGFALGLPFDIGGGAYDRRASVEAWLPAFVIAGEDPPWQIGVSKVEGVATDNLNLGGPVVDTLREAVARWNAQATPGARGIIAVMDNATYEEALTVDHAIALPPGARLAIVAADWPRIDDTPELSRRDAGQLAPQNRRPFLLGGVMIAAEDADEETGGALVLDGLAISGNVSARAGGDLGALSVFNCTIGGNRGTLDRGIRAPSDNARMSLHLDRSIVGRVDLPLATGPVTVRRSIIGEDQTAGEGAGALRLPLADLDLAASTVFGRTECRSLRAENAILTGRAVVGHRQAGCVRFCYVTEGSVVPRRYRCVPSADDDPKPRPVFVSTRWQDVALGLLGLHTPKSIVEGAEDGMEMGVGFAERDPARRANIRDAVQEFAPFGLIPGLIYMMEEVDP